jgi:hypothetical protein
MVRWPVEASDMNMIFPGMDPYLEDPQLWHGFHQRMAVYLAEQLQPLLLPRYVASVEDRVYVEGPEGRTIIPDVWLRRERLTQSPARAAAAVLEPDTAVEFEVSELEVHESYVTVLDLQSDQRVVTVIEIVSPTNKYAGPGRTSYLAKQREVLASQAHLVEIDFHRYGPHVLAVPERYPRSRGPYDYLVSVNRASGQRQRFKCYLRTVRDRLPIVHVPLADGDQDVPLDLQAVVARVYEVGVYRIRIRYDRPCVPPLSPDDQAWADGLIRQAQAAEQASGQPG